MNPTEPEPAPAAPRRLPGLPSLALALLALLAYANGLDGELLYDDVHYIVENPQVQEGGLADAFSRPLADRPELGLYRPLAVWSYQLQSAGRGAESPALPFHALNVALHALVSILVARWGRCLGLGRTAAFLGAACFAVHPAHVEAVTWVVGRAELLAALFGLLFLELAWKAQRPILHLGAALVWALACLGKEGAFALPAVLLLQDALRRPSAGVLAWRYGPLAVVFAGMVILRITVIGQFGPATDLASFVGLTWWERPWVALNLLGEYTRVMLLPYPDRLFHHSSEFLGWRWVCLLPLAALALGVRWARREPARWILALGFVLALLPVLNLEPIQETFALRFLYLPSVFACLLLGEVMAGLLRHEIARRGRVGGSLALPGLVLSAGLGLCWLANTHWKNPLELWLHNLEVAPASFDPETDEVPIQFPYRGLGFPYHHYQVGFYSYSENLLLPRDPRRRGARAHFRYALVLNEELRRRGLKSMPPDQESRAHLNLGRMESRELPAGNRDLRRAEQHLREAVRVAAQYEQLDFELGQALFELSLLRGRTPGVDLDLARRVLHDASLLQIPDALRAVVEQERQRVEREIEAAQRADDTSKESQSNSESESS